MKNVFKRKSHVILFAAVSGAFMLVTSCFGGCDVYAGAGGKAGAQNELSIASWNVQAIFDGTDEGIEYDEYRSDSGWNEQKYLARLNAISQAVSQIEETGPDVLALIELENGAVLQTLSDEYLTKSHYKYGFFANTPGYSLGVGMLSRYPFTKKFSHSSNIMGEKIPRPIAELWIEPAGKPIVIFVCHWKSKLGGEMESELMRRNAARIILRRVKEINIEYSENPPPIVVLGDLNENYDEFYRNSCEYVCAIMPDDPAAAILAGYAAPEQDEDAPESEIPFASPPQDFLILSNEKPPRSAFFYGADGVFYSPWQNEMQNGSYYYGQSWETIDHFLLSGGFFDKNGWEFSNAFVLDSEPFVNTKGEPNIYNVRSGNGLSDHLPIMLVLKKD
ncbi:MAG: endonuclease/exonuclease/phosphatase family protein [Termitinemataceae bacterium]|nr:MAG: endonuclease/exonuclease/phosphatase family protein [Termitinemataceae bacterium]